MLKDIADLVLKRQEADEKMKVLLTEKEELQDKLKQLDEEISEANETKEKIGREANEVNINYVNFFLIIHSFLGHANFEASPGASHGHLKN